MVGRTPHRDVDPPAQRPEQTAETEGDVGQLVAGRFGDELTKLVEQIPKRLTRGKHTETRTPLASRETPRAQRGSVPADCSTTFTVTR